MTAYYNEIDPFAAQWLRELIKEGHIAPGVVDERSIEDVEPSDLDDFTQCHFFAGIGVWSKALRNADWSDTRQVWTGSCPCQPFSAAGEGNGFADERHLWPAWFHLINQCRPAIVFGEQVARKDGLAWLDLIQSDMEGLGYTVGAIVAPSAGFGAPHIRERLNFVGLADTSSKRQSRPGQLGHTRDSTARSNREKYRVKHDGKCNGLADTEHARLEGRTERFNCTERRTQQSGSNPARSVHDRLADTNSDGREARMQTAATARYRDTVDANGSGHSTGPVNGFWRDSDWLLCRDGKFRPVRSGTFPLAHGIAARMGRLRGYGNAVNLQQTEAFITATMELIE